ncbi:MAG: hypothetical protein VX028_01935 [Nanoarchaeota archaeon]|nr:hypothetical protein [Nanoarchaeota archaeon]MEC8339782.1 hypothetical protein [Nanoarchaeota archaeon]
MGRILNLKSQSDEKINVTLELTTKEVLWLKGNLDKMHLFSENNLEFESRLVQRGRRESTKYFLLPKEFRKDSLPCSSVPCTRIETKTRYIFLFSIGRF